MFALELGSAREFQDGGQNMEQNDRLEKNKDFFQGKQLLNTKLLRVRIC